jgi:subtilisin family serine protease
MTLDEQLQAMGHARVLVVLKPQKFKKVDGGQALALNETISLQQDAAQTLRKHFRYFRNSRSAVLARGIAASVPRSAAAPTYVVDEKAKAVSASSSVQYFPNLGIMLGTVDRKGLTALRKSEKQVTDVLSPPELSLIRPVEDAALAGPPTGQSWSLPRLKIPDLWDKGLTGTGVLIGQIDTGVDVSHPALTTAVNTFAMFDPTGRQVANAQATDSGFHGTHTAGIMVGQPFQELIFGVAPGAQLAAAMVIEGGDVAARVVGGLDWCVGQGVRLINISLGLTTFQPQFSTIMQLLRQRNILPIVAIGNEGVQTSRTPGNLPEALSVGAFDDQDQIWSSSSSQQMAETPKRYVPLVIGPGSGIWSSVPGAKLQSLSGTSMATPHITGLAALLLQHRSEATADDLEKAIVTSCKRPPAISTLRGNNGVPDAADALKALG